MNNKKKNLLIVGGVNLVIISYLVILLFAFLKIYGKPDESSLYKPVKYQITNEVIKSYSHLNPSDASFHYSSDEGEYISEIIFMTSGDNASIGTYDPQSYIYGTSDKTITITFELSETPLYKVSFDEIKVSDNEGHNVKKLARSAYSTSMKSGKGVLKYSSNKEKYIYSVSLTYYIKK